MNIIKQNLLSFTLSFFCIWILSSCQTTPNSNQEENFSYTKVAILLPLTGPDAQPSQEYIRMVKAGLRDGAKKGIRVSSYDSSTPELLNKSLDKIIDSGTDIIIGPIYTSPTKIVAKKIKNKSAIAISLSNNPNLAGKQLYVFGHQPMKQLQELIRYSLSENYDSYVTLLPSGQWSNRTNKIISELVKSHNKKLVGMEFYNDDDIESINQAVAKTASLVDEINENDKSLYKPVIILSDDSYNLDKLINVVKSYQIDKKAIILSDNRINFGIQDSVDVVYTGSINLIEQNFLEMANHENIKNISFMHILAYDAGKMVGINIGEKYNREEFCARMNSSKFKGFAAQETYFTDNIAQRKYQIIKKKDNQFRVLLVK
ncbi:MAG TPA: penicillin-binding protein activator [Candidatus Megaira endosymbiont of Nemacystus decipiens]|nr:penicillin-binding protein activator [Candidatus Megaera endosymbiont of Nemacystus decipiens]